MDDYLSKTAQQQRNRYDSNKIIEYLDSENLFEVNFVTLNSLDIGIIYIYITCLFRHFWQSIKKQYIKFDTKNTAIKTRIHNQDKT